MIASVNLHPMNAQPARLTITRKFLEKTKEKLEAFLHFAEPDEQFRFVTFEGNDYAEQKLTMLVFSYVPDRVLVTVPAACDLENALQEIGNLNPGVVFEKVPLSYFHKANGHLNRQTQELRIINISLQVDASGRLSR